MLLLLMTDVGLLTVPVLWGIIKVIPVFKQISSEAMDSQELLQKSYMLHGASEVWKSVICKSYVPITCS
jgi:hypothetical protein